MIHYAGEVKYTTTGFLEKNRDSLAIEVVAALRIADNHLVSLIFGGEEGARVGGSGNARKTKAALNQDQQKDQLDYFRTICYMCREYFIR